MPWVINGNNNRLYLSIYVPIPIQLLWVIRLKLPKDKLYYVRNSNRYLHFNIIAYLNILKY